MKLFELHNALARTIGDPVPCTGSLFIDGVRFSTQLRAQYLWQSMNDVMMTAIQKVSAASPTVQSEVMERLFPSMVAEEKASLPLDVSKCAFVLAARYKDAATNVNVTLPIVKNYQAIKTSLGRNSLVQPSDPFLVYADNNAMQIVGINTEDLDGKEIAVTFIKRPPSINWIMDEANGNEDIKNHYEYFWISEVLRRSALLALIDSGEAGTAPQYVPLSTIIQQG